YGDLDAASDDVWQELLQTNLYGPWYCSRAAAPHLRRSHGSIVNIASMAAHRAGGSSIPYGVSKAALVQLTRGLALALAPAVRVNSVSPGLVRTRWVTMKKSAAFAEQAEAHWAETSPLRRVVTAEDVAEAVLGLIGAKGVTGQDLIVDTGQMILQPR
ncbi:MAG TPA: SDR family oxidoreductase, partial [Acidothermaceae bacterium]|nr:SDR family oxidoreductase [Acidothermaceae bacterium]